MSKRDDLVDLSGNEEMLFVDPERFDAAIVGYVDRIGVPSLTCYDKNKVIEILMEDDMSWEEAEEYYEYNIVGAYMGANTPVFLTLL